MTNRTHCKLPSCQSIQQPEPGGQVCAQYRNTGCGIPTSYQASGLPCKCGAIARAACATMAPLPGQLPVPALPVDEGRHGPPPTVEPDNCTEKMATSSSRAATTATPRLPSPPSSFSICLLLPLLLPLRECDEPHCRPG